MSYYTFHECTWGEPGNGNHYRRFSLCVRFYCSKDNYTLAQPGVQTKIMALKDLMKRLDGEFL